MATSLTTTKAPKTDGYHQRGRQTASRIDSYMAQSEMLLIYKVGNSRATLNASY